MPSSTTSNTTINPTAPCRPGRDHSETKTRLPPPPPPSLVGGFATVHRETCRPSTDDYNDYDDDDREKRIKLNLHSEVQYFTARAGPESSRTVWLPLPAGQMSLRAHSTGDCSSSSSTTHHRSVGRRWADGKVRSCSLSPSLALVEGHPPIPYLLRNDYSCVECCRVNGCVVDTRSYLQLPIYYYGDRRTNVPVVSTVRLVGHGYCD